MVNMYIVTNTTIFLIVRLLLLRYNYTFRPSMLAIFRLYMKYLTISYMYMWVGSLQFVGWDGCEISFCVWLEESASTHAKLTRIVLVETRLQGDIISRPVHATVYIKQWECKLPATSSQGPRYKHTQAGIEGPQELYPHNYSHPRTEFSMRTTLLHK